MMNEKEGSRFLRLAIVVGLYAVAMAYLEAAVVVYLQQALKINLLALFPLRDPASLLVMLTTVGWLAGRRALEPMPWVAPVWAPMVVSFALITFGLVVARRLQNGELVPVKAGHAIATVGGGLVVVFSFTIDARRILDGGTPISFAWPIFVAGMALAIIGVAPLSLTNFLADRGKGLRRF